MLMIMEVIKKFFCQNFSKTEFSIINTSVHHSKTILCTTVFCVKFEMRKLRYMTKISWEFSQKKLHMRENSTIYITIHSLEIKKHPY